MLYRTIICFSFVFHVVSFVTQSVDEDSSVTSESLSDAASLDECISHFMEPEVLGSDEAWYCPRCKTHREAIKQLSVWRLPKYVIFQLKRFSYRNLLWSDKVDRMVDFPTRYEIDLHREIHAMMSSSNMNVYFL